MIGSINWFRRASKPGRERLPSTKHGATTQPVTGQIGKVVPAVTSGAYNELNQLTAEQAGGQMRVRGETDEEAVVRVKSNANPYVNAQTTAADEFFAWVEVEPGLNTLTVEATDTSPNANVTVQNYEVTVAGNNRNLSYDLNGNLIDNGAGQTYAWDAENRLVRITYGNNSKTQFTYDGYVK